jgi:AraC family transcriptional regulator
MDLEATVSDHRAIPGTADLPRRAASSFRVARVSPPAAGARTVQTRSASGCAGLAPWQLARVRRHIERHLGSRLTNAGLAALVGLNEDYFARAFKVSAGCPPHAYVVKRRIEHAKSLLLGGNLPLCQVALAAGFADQAHLSRRFRKTVGASPASWRRRCVSIFEWPRIRWI